MNTLRYTAALVLSAGGALVGQSVTTIEPAVTPIHAGTESGRYFAAAGDYKVELRADGVVFTPYLGARVARNQSLGWRTVSITRGGEALGLGTPRAGVVSGTRFEIHHAGVVEAYDVLESGLEQTFVVSAPPPGGGDLVVRGAIRTDLRADSRGFAHAPITFCDSSGVPTLEYGCAFGVDAADGRIDLCTARDGEFVEIRVPGSWLETADYPVTIDPLLAVVSIDAGAALDHVDLIRDAAIGEVMISYVRAASASDFDEFAQIRDADYSNPTTVFADLSPDRSATATSVTMTGLPQVYVLVTGRDRAATGGGWRIGFHTRAAGDRTFSSTWTELPQETAGHDWRPVVGGTSFENPGTAALIAWQREPSALALGHEVDASEVRVRTLEFAGGAPIVGPESQLDVMGPFVPGDHERPTVNKIGDADRPWFVAWQRSDLTQAGGGDWSVFSRLVDAAGAVSWAAYGDTQDSLVGSHRMMPRVAGRQGRFVLAWTKLGAAGLPARPSQPHGTEVWCNRVTWSNMNGAAIRWEPEPLHVGGANREWELGAMAFDEHSLSHWTVTAMRQGRHGGDGSIHATRLGHNGRVVDGHVLHPGLPGEENASVGSVFDTNSDDVGFVFGLRDQTGGGAAFARDWQHTAAAPPTHYGVACTPAQIEWVDQTVLSPGSQQIGAEFTYVRLAGASVQHAWAILLIGTAPAAIDLSGLGLPGCHAYVPVAGTGHIGTRGTNTGLGYRTVQLAIPEEMPETVLHFQWMYQVAEGDFDWKFTEGLAVELVR